MDHLLGENWPETCSALGLDCGTCTRKSAATVAKICFGLEAHGVQRIFLELYPSPGCRPMAAAFEVAYREASGLSQPPLTTAAAAAA
jgi:hypothetical protein